MNIIDFTGPKTGNIFADLILWLVSITSSVAAGVILFTVFLKLITLPFDFMSRFSMRKNSLKMEEMRPELEKLQKQYAGDKNLYNQKMMALYKKNGYSMFGSCLPTIITLVIFIIAINGFNAYSHYQNKQYFYEMSIAYNNVIYAGLEVDGEYIYTDKDGKIQVNDALLLGKTEVTPEGKDYKIIVEYKAAESKQTIYTTNGYVKYTRTVVGETGTGTPEFTVIESNLTNDKIKSDYNNNLVNSEGKTFDEAKADGVTAEEFIQDICEIKSAERFRNNGSGFLWVKNIWVTDSPMKHPIEEKWETFKSTYGYNDASYKDIGQDGYDKLIADLEFEKTAPNGFFILVILTAASSLLTQLVVGKSQKAQMELQTVNGQGAQTQKIMMWMMPIMMAIFAFMYTAAFSIYIVLSSVISLLTTLLINYIADKKYKKKPADGDVVHGRVYVPPKKEEEAKPKKKEKGEPEVDFLSGLADKKKRPRGRIK